MNTYPVQIDVTTAADFKGLLQTIIVRRFKNNVGIRYDAVEEPETNGVLGFNSYVALFCVADNKDYLQFPATTTMSKTGETFKVGVQCQKFSLCSISMQSQYAYQEHNITLSTAK